jgi:hypothetical protein
MGKSPACSRRANADDISPDALSSVERFADVVVAVDDGSTDAPSEVPPATRRRTLLRHPRRLGCAGWEDGANRNELFAG